MRRAKKLHRQFQVAAAMVAGTLVAVSSTADAADFSWVPFSAGTYDWTNAGNWSPAGVPNANVDSANVSGPVSGGPLVINLPSDISVATLTMGATGTAQTTQIGSSGGTFIWDAGAGTFLLNSVGVAGAVNQIAAPVQLGAGTTALLQFRIGGTNDIDLSGGLTAFMDNVGTALLTRQLTLANGAYTLGSSGTLTNNLGTLMLGTTRIGAINLAQVGATQNGSLQINTVGTNSIGGEPIPANVLTFVHGGTIILAGEVSNGGRTGGRLTLGSNNATVAPAYVIQANNTYTGNTTLSKGDYYIQSDTPFGLGQVNQNPVANTFTVRLYNDSDTRQINNVIQLQRAIAFAGEHSFTVNGYVHQSNTTALINLLPEGKQLTFNGFISPVTTNDTARTLSFDGDGLTVVNGPIYNHRKPWAAGTLTDLGDEEFSTGSIIKRGPGTLVLDPIVFPTLQLTGGGTISGPTSTYRGLTGVLGGLVEFSSPAAYGKLDSFSADILGFGPLNISNNPGTSQIYAVGGAAVGVRTGSLTGEFLGKLAAGTLAAGNTGAIALSTVDSAATIDFTSGDLAGSNLRNMSIGALSSGVTFTGTIIPNPTTGYRLGGGGKLTLPNTNQLTGANNVTITNGGEVAVTGLNNYTGTTTIRGDYLITDQEFARSSTGTNNFGFNPYAVRTNSVLSVSVLADGGSASGVGASGNAAGNLVFQGGTLKYTGAGSSTDRLFTMNPIGATLDASGTGAVQFTNTGAIAQVDAAPRTGNVQTGTNGRIIPNVGDVSDLTPGMVVSAELAGVGTYLPAGVQVTGLNYSISNAGVITGNIAIGSAGLAAGTAVTLTFTQQDRPLNLTGTSTADNVLAAQLVDSAAGKLRVVKSGPGNWSLTNANNTYTGGTTVNAGTLSVKRLLNNGPTKINGGTLRIGPGGAVGDAASTSVFAEGGFEIAGGATPAGRLDLNKNGAIFDYDTTSPGSTIASLIVSGRAGGSWTGNGITSSAAAAAPSTHAVGYAEASDLGSPASFLGQPVDATAVLVRYTRQGDANLDGTTGIADFSRLAANFNLAGNWSKGDFNYDGTTGIADFSLLAANFNLAAAGDSAAARGGVVPEPGVGVAALALIALAAGRRRTRG